MATLKNTVVNSTGALQLPVGTTAQRPTAATGQMRYNSSLGTCEFYDGTRWKYMPDIVRSGLVLHLDAAEPSSYPGTGTTWYDLSGNGYNGTVDAGVTFNTNYWNFDYGQVNDRITIANNSHLNYDYANWSYNIWLYYESADSGSWKQLFVKGDGNSYRRPGIWFYADDPQKLHITWADGNQEAITKTGFSVPIGTWSNITIQASSGTMTSYLNGVQDSQSIAISNKAANSNPLYIGNISGSYTAPNMRMGVFQTYNRALTPVEIQQNFNALRRRYGL